MVVNFLTHSLTHGAEPFLRSRQLCSHSRISQHFMEPEGLLPCSQEPSTGPYPYPISRRSILILFTQFPVVSHLLAFRPISYMYSSSPLFMLHALPISSSWVLCHQGMVLPQVADGGDTLQVWRIAGNILNKPSRTADKGWSSSLGVGRGADNSSPQNINFLWKFSRSLRPGQFC
jgi:hypothetical protein